MQTTTKTLLTGILFPEGPRWHEDKLWFSDMNAGRVITVDMDGNADIILQIPGSTSGLGWLPDGRLLIVSMQDRRLLRMEENGTLTEVADISSLASCHCNDMVVDKKGRAYIGNFGFDLHNEEFKLAEIVMVTPQGKANIVADNMAFPNGSVITPDDKTFIVGETWGGCLTAFDIQPDGTLKNRRIWAKLTNAVPDGICLDAEGGIWVASPGSAEVLRVLEGGEVTHSIKVSTQAYACMLGGPDKKTLFIMTSGPQGGCVETVQVEIPGAGLP